MESRARAADGDSQPVRAHFIRSYSAVVDVDVDRAWDHRLAAAEAEIRAENVEQNQDDDDQQNDGKEAAATAAAGFDNGRVFAFHIVAIIGHWKLSLFCLLNRRNERTAVTAVPNHGEQMKRPIIALAVLALTGCGRADQRTGSSNQVEEAVVANEAGPTLAAPGTGPDARTPLGTAERTIDPKSPEAARELVRRFGALIEEGDWSEAQKLWSNADAAVDLTSRLKRFRDVHLKSGKSAEPEGAAGSIYVTVPVTLYETDLKNHSFRRSANLILRRVNDVPGSTEAQRRWHIERIDWGAGT
jgi:hypothetical protein